MADVAAALRGVLDARPRGRAFHNQFGQIENARAFAIAGIEHAAGARRLGEKSKCPDNIFDINEVARLPAIAENNEGLTRQRTGDKYRNRCDIRTLGILARAEHIEEPDRGCLQPPLAAEKFAIVFPVELGDRIRTAWVGSERFGFHLGGILAVDGCRTGKAKFFHSGPPGCLEDM